MHTIYGDLDYVQGYLRMGHLEMELNDEDFEKFISAAEYSFENFACGIYDSLSMPADMAFIERKKQEIEKILRGIINNLSSSPSI